jgi:hypothetical protein
LGRGNDLVFLHDDFNHIRGTSHIIRSDLLCLPQSVENADIKIVKSLLGSHYYIQDILEEKGVPLAASPFRGAMYSVNNVNSHSKYSAILTKYIFKRYLAKHPRRFLKNLLSLRIMTRAIREKFVELELMMPYFVNTPILEVTLSIKIGAQFD